MRSFSLIERIKGSSLVVFRLSDISRILGKSKEYSSLYLYRLKKKGYIHEIEKGKYALKDSNVYAVASNIISPSYISFLSALSYYKITTQLPKRITVASPKSKKLVIFQGYEIEFVRLNGKKIFGIRKDIFNNKAVFAAEIEKAIVDSLYLPEYCPIDEANNAIMESEINIERITEYALRMNSIVLLKRLGFLLEKKGADISRRIESKLNNRYDLLNPFSSAKGEKNRKWRLIINE